VPAESPTLGFPGGMSKEITAGQAARILASITSSGAVEAARCELAAEFTEDLRGIDARIRDTRKKLAIAVRAAGTSLTGLLGVGPVTAVIGDVRQVSRFASRDNFAACNGTAPIEVSSGGPKVYRLSRRGNRRLNHAIHMVAVTQIRYRHSPGRAYYEKKLAEGKTGKEALRAEAADQRCHLRLPPRRRPPRRSRRGEEPGRATGERLCIQRGRLTPRTPALRTSHSRDCHPPYDPSGRRYPCSPSRSAAIPRERASGSRTGRSPAAQRRPQGVLDAPAREPIMPRGGKRPSSGPAPPSAGSPICTVRLTLKQRGVRSARSRWLDA
jgi:hypothetical protein